MTPKEVPVINKPNRQHHAKILGAYLNRLPLGQLEEIVQAQRVAYQASLNGGNTQQRVTQAHADAITFQAVRHITDYDLALIEATVQDSDIATP